MFCPYCGSQMDDGYVRWKDGVSWSHKKQVVSAGKPSDGDSVKMGEDSGGLDSDAVAAACRCDGCKKIIFSYGGGMFFGPTWAEEFDGNREAVVNPTDVISPVLDMPSVVVSCFAKETFERMVDCFGGVKIGETRQANMVIPVYKVCYKGVSVGMFLSPVGAPACVSAGEEIFAMGAETLILFGTCGVLDRSIEDCSVIIPHRAVRDEGTSFHYVPAASEIQVNLRYVETFTGLLEELGCNYTTGKTWTTDGIYRETREKVNRRKQSGCICVDMECSAMTAMAEFRGKELFQFFYAADNLDGETWDIRSLDNEANLEGKDRVARLAVELAARVSVLRDKEG